VHFATRVFVGMHEEFVNGAIQDLLKTGAIRPWIEQKPITVISGLGVEDLSWMHGILTFLTSMKASHRKVIQMYPKFTA